MVVVALLEGRDHVEVVARVGIALLMNGLDAFNTVFVDGDGRNARGACRALLGAHDHGLSLPLGGMHGHATNRRDAVEDERDVVAFAHFSDGFGVLCDAAAGFVVANQQGFIATTLKLLFEFVEVKGATPFVFELFYVAELTADVRHTFTELSVGGDEHQVVVSKTIRDDHLHRGGSASRDHDDTVAVLSGPGL